MAINSAHSTIIFIASYFVNLLLLFFIAIKKILSSHNLKGESKSHIASTLVLKMLSLCGPLLKGCSFYLKCKMCIENVTIAK